MRFSLRAFLIAFLLVGPLSIWSWPKYQAWQRLRDEQRFQAEIEAKWLQVEYLSQKMNVPHRMNVGCPVGMTPQDWDRRVSIELKRFQQSAGGKTIDAAADR
jgi:hypothetical protein